MNSDRYDRQCKVIGVAGQKKLQSSSVFIVGSGGIGCPIALYLATSGVGKITIIDDDSVSLSNLHRQILFREQDIGLLKSDVAKKHLEQLNSEVIITSISQKLTDENIDQYFKSHDLIIIGCDNYETRYLANDACCRMNIPFIDASVLGDEGSLVFFDIKHGCYQCLFPKPPPELIVKSPTDIGVLGPLVGVIGTLAATMAVEVIIGNASNYINKVYKFDSLSLKLKDFPFTKEYTCDSCSHS